jgi:hypothetical protein
MFNDALKSLCNQFTIDLQSIYNRFAIALKLQSYCFAIGLQSDCNRIEVAIALLCDRCVIACAFTVQSLCNRSAIALQFYRNPSFKRYVNDLNALKSHCDHHKVAGMFMHLINNRIANHSRIMANRFVVVMQSYLNFENALQSLCGRFVIAL